ncbi:MAG: hypothetical protein H0W99_07275 [Acidobacteria bacterium]|nr:hypothetical protein [Acidobacteriota bacterium]
MTTALEPRSKSTEMLAKIIDGINRLDDARKDLMDTLPHLEDEEIIQTRMGARALGAWSWVIECGCDAEMMKRVEVKRGRGNKDVDQKGKVAAVNKHAYQCGQQPATIYRNVQIYNTFQNVLIVQNNLLEEKGFYEAALRTDNPPAALEVFAREKDKNVFFSVRDAYREAEKLKQKTFRLSDSTLDKVWDRIQDGCYTADAILKCGECGKNIFDLDADQIKLYMEQLVGSGKAEWRDQGGKTDVGRGGPTELCVPVDLPAGSNYRAYRPTVEYGDDSEEF